MYKLLLFIVMSAFIMMLNALQWDEEIALHALFQAKHALNRAVHAAAQQLDEERLKAGIMAIDEEKARSVSMEYLQRNLRLDSSNSPLPGSFLKSKVEVLEFAVINHSQPFPHTYYHPAYDYAVTLEHPGVIMIIRVHYPRTYSVLGPISWEIKGAGELVW